MAQYDSGLSITSEATPATSQPARKHKRPHKTQKKPATVRVSLWTLLDRLRACRGLPIPRHLRRILLRSIRQELVSCVREVGYAKALMMGEREWEQDINQGEYGDRVCQAA